MPRKVCVAFLILPLVIAADRPTRPLQEIHEQVFLDGTRIGSTSFTLHDHDPASKLFRSTTVLDLTLKRYGSLVRLRREESHIENADGHVQSVTVKQGVPGGRMLVLQGTRIDDEMTMRFDAGRMERRLRWTNDVLGLNRQLQQFAGKKLQPGDKFAFQRYEPTYNTILNVRAEVKPAESVELLGERKQLTRIDLTPDRLEANGRGITPPTSTVWVNEAGAILRRRLEMDGLGTLILVRTTRDKIASAPVTGVDIGARSLISLDRAFSRPYETRSIVYRVSVRDESDPASLLVSDGHQKVDQARAGTFELHVHPVMVDAEGGKAVPEVQYLAPSHFLDHDHEKIVEMAKRAVGEEKNRWQKAVRIERYVRNLMRNDNEAPLEPASVIAANPRGDCRHHAFLTASLCRAAGLPSRTAIGLLYVYKGGPKLGFHMWTEVLINGQWLGIDSTLGKGGVSATHIKITDHSWHETASLTPLLPVNRFLGKCRFEVVRVD